jgi:hypothetical protein
MNHILKLYPFEVFDWEKTEEGMEVMTTVGNFHISTHEAGDILEKMEHGIYRPKRREIEYKQLDSVMKQWETVTADPVDYMMDYCDMMDINWWIDSKLKKIV